MGLSQLPAAPAPAGPRPSTATNPSPGSPPADNLGFTDVRIVGVDKQRTRKPDPSLDLYDVHLQLSSRPPADWGRVFEAQRSFPRHTMWRRAWVDGSYIVVNCGLDELQRYHIPDLKTDVAAANDKYRELLRQAQAQQTQTERKAEEERRRKDEALDALDLE